MLSEQGIADEVADYIPEEVDRLDQILTGYLAFGTDKDAVVEEFDLALGVRRIVAQTGDGVFEPEHMRWVRSLSREDYAAAMEAADLIVAHAGVGSVVTAGEYARPIVLLPRRAALGEHRNDHQADTAGWLRDRPGIYVADDETELAERIAAARRADATASPPMSKTAPPEFLEKLRKFVLE